MGGQPLWQAWPTSLAKHTIGLVAVLCRKLSPPAERHANRLMMGVAPLTPDACVDIMSTHENHQANTSQGILDAIPAG